MHYSLSALGPDTVESGQACHQNARLGGFAVSGTFTGLSGADDRSEWEFSDNNQRAEVLQHDPHGSKQ